MPLPTPIQITLYTADNEVKATFSQGFVPWRMLKKAVSLSKTLNGGELTDELVDAMAGLVVETFGDRFTVKDLDDGAEITEMIAVINQIVAKAFGAMPVNPANPTKPG